MSYESSISSQKPIFSNQQFSPRTGRSAGKSAGVTGGDVASLVGATTKDKLKPSDRQLRAAFAGQVIPGERFGLVKATARKLWNNKLTIVGSSIVAGGAAAAAFTHASWLPQALHLATTPVGIAVLAGLGALALVGATAYLVRNSVTTLRHAQVRNARAIVKGERQAAKAEAQATPRPLRSKSAGAAFAAAAEEAQVKTPVAKPTFVEISAQAQHDALQARVVSAAAGKTTSEPVLTKRSLERSNSEGSAGFADAGTWAERSASTDSLDRLQGPRTSYRTFDGRVS